MTEYRNKEVILTQEQWDLVKHLFRPRPRVDVMEPTARDDAELAR